MKKITSDLKLGIGLVLFCLATLVFIIPTQVGPLNDEASLMPVLITLIILLLSLNLCFLAWRGIETGPKVEHQPNGSRRGILLGVTLVMITYAWLFETIGFIAVSMLTIVALFLVFGIRRTGHIAAISIITVSILYISFEKLLNAPLPLGTVLEAILY